MTKQTRLDSPNKSLPPEQSRPKTLAWPRHAHPRQHRHINERSAPSHMRAIVAPQSAMSFPAHGGGLDTLANKTTRNHKHTRGLTYRTTPKMPFGDYEPSTDINTDVTERLYEQK